MNIDSIQNGIVIDHITAGLGMRLYDLLGLEKLDCSVAIIKNAGRDRLCGPGRHRQHHSRRRARGEKAHRHARDPYQRDLLQKSPLHHLLRTGAQARFRPHRPQEQGLPLSLLRNQGELNPCETRFTRKYSRSSQRVSPALVGARARTARLRVFLRKQSPLKNDCISLLAAALSPPGKTNQE